MEEHLLLVLEAPLVAFGIERVDARGPVGDFPGASLLTGLLANALGWRREQRAAHDRLQGRLRFGVRLDRVAARLEDFQTVQLAADDAHWTTRGGPEGRTGGPATYNAPHIRRRQMDADVSAAIALRLDPAGDAPSLADLAAALRHPARPLFIGRKPCLPTRPIFAGLVDADSLLAALAAIPSADEAEPDPRVLLPPGEPGAGGERLLVADLRNWRSGLHGGQREMRLGRVRSSAP